MTAGDFMQINAIYEMDATDGQSQGARQERQLLGDQVVVDDLTLRIRFTAMPLDEEDEFNAAASTDGRVITAPNNATEDTEVQVALYLTKVVDQRMELATPLADLTLACRNLRQRAISTQEDSYRNRATFHPGSAVSIAYRVALQPDDITVDIESIETTPEWWLCQLSNPYSTSSPYVTQNHAW